MTGREVDVRGDPTGAGAVHAVDDGQAGPEYLTHPAEEGGTVGAVDMDAGLILAPHGIVWSRGWGRESEGCGGEEERKENIPVIHMRGMLKKTALIKREDYLGRSESHLTYRSFSDLSTCLPLLATMFSRHDCVYRCSRVTQSHLDEVQRSGHACRLSALQLIDIYWTLKYNPRRRE